MSYRKRNQMQHKVELSTLLKMVIVSRLIKQNKQAKNQLVNSLANEAIEALKWPEVFAGRKSFSKNVKQKIFA